MLRCLLLSTTALAALALAPAHAATCTETFVGGDPVFTCDAPGSAPIADARDDLTVTVTDTGSIVSATGDNAPLDLSGDDGRVTNHGLIDQTDTSGDAIAVRGTGLTIENSGTIRSGDRAIHSRDGDGALTVINLAGGRIESRRQAVRGGVAFPGTEVINHGVIFATEGRAIQVRGQGSRVINHGELYGGQEVVEARDDFYIENHGLMQIDVTVDDEDGLQFASGEAHNWGTIVGTDDGIDIDEGLVHNYATGRIISLGPDDSVEKSAIDVDGAFANSRDPRRAAGDLTIINEGYMEGPRGITSAYDPDLPDDDVEQSRSSIHITNTGTIIGRGGIAIGLSPLQGDSSLTLGGASEIYGDVRFGAGDDVLNINMLTSTVLLNSVFDGGAGFNTVNFLDYDFAALLGFAQLSDGTDRLRLRTLTGVVGAKFTDTWDLWTFRDGSFTTAELRANAPAPIPLPGGMALLVGALGGLALLRRRKMA